MTHLVEARQSYFAETSERIEDGNFRYSEERVFQNELLRTLTLVFENDLENIFNEKESLRFKNSPIALNRFVVNTSSYMNLLKSFTKSYCIFS